MLISTRGFAAARVVSTSFFATTKSVAPCQAKCFGYGKLGHWTSVCKAGGRSNQGKVFNVTGNGKHRHSENDDREDVFTGGLWLNALGTDKIVVFEKSVNFTDTGADVSCVPTSVVPEQMLQIVKKTEEPISGPDGHRLKVIGFLDLVLETKDKQTSSKVFVISGLQTAILGRQCLQNLGIVYFKEGRCMVAKVYGECDLVSEFSKVNVRVEFSELVHGLGKMKDTVKIVLKRNAVRICGDYTEPHFPSTSVESKLALLKREKYFSKIDANSSFYQIELAKESQVLTTFITPFDIYFFKRLPFGISTSQTGLPRFWKTFHGLCFMWIIFLFMHPLFDDSTLREVLHRLQNEGTTINKGKSVFGVTSVRYLGYILTSKGISVDPERVLALSEFSQPKTTSELKKFLGIVIFSALFLTSKSEILESLFSLFKKDTEFVWGPAQAKAFANIKGLLLQTPNLAFSDPEQ
ncbi:hypothetical protein PR048_002953 [Dryococelus australis]|uniref:Uncharacterized protein n=1 Tax=Dryococelus australis TaxID=614101 RepID=A0ABQ9ILP9_9NEOP|nr:hypothetical protein PR048_002953 [Dryococelus australis]